jgi:hypothetical protein
MKGMTPDDLRSEASSFRHRASSETNSDLRQRLLHLAVGYQSSAAVIEAGKSRRR